MATVKTDYGLIYKDDGSLCVTRRTDDVPFPGTTAWAVERETTNLATAVVAHGCLEEDAGTYLGMIAKRYSVTNPNTYNNFGFKQVDNIPLSGTETHLTLSFYARMIEPVTSATLKSGYIKVYYTDGTSENLTYADVVNELLSSKSNWHRVIITVALNTEKTPDYIDLFSVFTDNANKGIMEVAGVQLETKPFATSFVDGTRANGKLYIPLEKLPFNPQTDNFVISYWKKPIATRDDTLTDSNVFTIGRWTTDYSVGYMFWGKAIDINKFRIYVNYVGGSGSSYSAAFDPNWYFNNWHYEVIRKYNNQIDYYVDAQLQCSLVLTDNIEQFDTGLYIGSISGSPCNSLIADIYFGSPTDLQDNLVWTDDYVRQVYEARAPFNVPPKIPVT